MTSWSSVLAAIDAELEDPGHRSDLAQLRALCVAADDGALVPFSASELSSQSTPEFVLQLSTIVQRAVELAVTKGVLSIDGLRPSASWDRIGRYVAFPAAEGVGRVVRHRLRKWWEDGSGPLWLVFSANEWGRALEVRAILQPLTEKLGLDLSAKPGDVGVPIEVMPGEEQDAVVKSIVNRLSDISSVLEDLPPKHSPIQ